MLNETAGIVDDIVVWWWELERYWVFPNAANHERVMAAFASEPGCVVGDMQLDTVLVAVQGPEAPRILEDIFGAAPGRFRTAEGRWGGGEVWLAGTGYTGERGGEIATDPETGHGIAEALLEAGVKPCGLGARDTLRLEAGLPLWGSDIDEGTTPLEAGLEFAVRPGRGFRGSAALESGTLDDPERRLVGFVLEEKGIPRHGYRVRTRAGGGEVTSGNLSPMLDRGIGLAYVGPPPAVGESIEVDIRGRWVAGRIVEPPFHKE
jgi:aminomethyltransferase